MTTENQPSWIKAFTPTEPRPVLNQETFLRQWCIDNYGTDEDGIYESLSDEWHPNASEEYIAEALIKYHCWDYKSAKEFEEKSISFDYNKQNNQLVLAWIKENSYTCPFAEGQEVLTPQGEVGTITKRALEQERDLGLGLIAVFKKEHEEHNRKLQESGSGGYFLGTIYYWEDLSVLSK